MSGTKTINTKIFNVIQSIEKMTRSSIVIKGRDNKRKDLADYMNSLTNEELLTEEQEKYLGWRIINENDSEAAEELGRKNLGFVIKVAKEFKNRGLPLIELIQEGNLGLMEAVHRFDPAQGKRFTTYAGWWIKKEIKQALAERSPEMNEIVRVPREVFYFIQDIKPYIQQCKDEGILPDIESIAKKYKRDKKVVKAVIAFHEGGHGRYKGLWTEKDDEIKSDPEVEKVMVNKKRIYDLPGVLHDFRDLLFKALERNEISLREREVFILYEGLGGEEPKTYEKIGEEVGLTREGSRLAWKRAVLKLTEDKDLSQLYDLLWRTF